MTWIKVDNSIFGNPKIERAGGDATLLYLAALCYSSQHSTDGFVSDARILLLTDRKHPAKLALKLSQVGLFERVEDGYLIHDYLEFQSSREQVNAKREKEAKRKAQYRLGKPPNVLKMSQRDKSVPSDDVPNVETETETDIDKKITNNNNLTRVDIHRPEVVVRAASLYAQLEAQRTTQPIRSLERWLAGTTRNILAEYGDKLEQMLATYPNASPQVLLLAATPLTEWDLDDLKTTGGYL